MLTSVGVGACLAAAIVCSFAAEQRGTEPLRIAVYDVPPYGYVDTDGSISGVSVDLWRRVAEHMEWTFKLFPVADMETILSGLEQGRFDAAIGAITITPERDARIDFSYPTHRSGVAVAVRKETGPFFALKSYAAAAAELSALIFCDSGNAYSDWSRHVVYRTTGTFQTAGVRILGRYVARRPLLGRRDDDNRGLWRQDTENQYGPRRRHPLDDGQRGADFTAIDQSGLSIDCGARWNGRRMSQRSI